MSLSLTANISLPFGQSITSGLEATCSINNFDPETEDVLTLTIDLNIKGTESR
jgi:hypothetical protein